MVPIFFRCMSCNHELQVAGEKAGEEIECPECGFVGKVPVPFKGQTGSRWRGASRQKEFLSLPPAYRAEAEITGRMEARPPASPHPDQGPYQGLMANWDQTWKALSILYLTTGVRFLLGLVTVVVAVLLPSIYLAIAGLYRSDPSAAVFSMIALVAWIAFAVVSTFFQIAEVISYSRCMQVPGPARRKVLIAITFALSLLSFGWNLLIPILVILARSGSLEFSLMEPLLAWVGATLLNPLALVRWLVFLLFLLSLARGLKATNTALGIGALLIAATGGIVVLVFLLVGLVFLSLDPRKSELMGWAGHFYLLLVWVGYLVAVLWYLVVLRKVRDEVSSLLRGLKAENSEDEEAG